MLRRPQIVTNLGVYRKSPRKIDFFFPKILNLSPCLQIFSLCAGRNDKKKTIHDGKLYLMRILRILRIIIIFRAANAFS